ncbi:MAG: hypothetical protein HRT68_01605 [Flavobacteriaceae bacterium]|nr:hypothetical protein [Flavobacteriaceae bacterium]
MKTALMTIFFLTSFWINPDQEMITLEKSDYTISYPKTWQIDQSDRLTEFYLFSKLEDQNDHFSENMNLITQNLIGMNINLDQYTEISINQIKKFFNDKILKVEKHKNKAGQEYYEVIYTGKQEGTSLTFMQYNFLKNGKAYVLTFTAETDKFDAYKDVVYKTFNSFRIK